MFLPAAVLLLVALCPRPSIQCKSKTPVVEEPEGRAARRIELAKIEQELAGVSRPGPELLAARARLLGLEAGEEAEAMREREGRQRQDLGRKRQDLGHAGRGDGMLACYSLIRPGWRFYDSVVREQLNRADTGSCAGECKRRVYCRSFAFSQSEFLGENCQLSELAGAGEDALQEDRDGRRDDMWAIYTVAEECDKSTSIRPPGLPQPVIAELDGECGCNGLIDSEGEGECRTPDARGRYWCYTDGSTCSSATPDTRLPFLGRTTGACTQGPCQCNQYGFHQAGSPGICQGDVFDSSTFCYVTLDSRCPDKQPSKFFPSFQWSMAACGQSQLEYGQEEEVTDLNDIVDLRTTDRTTEEMAVVERHGLWNFTSSYSECRDYCAMAERCKSMFTHYDNEQQLCHLSTRPFYPVSYTHQHGTVRPQHTHVLQDEDVERLWR